MVPWDHDAISRISESPGALPNTRRESSKNGNHILKKTVVFFFPWGQPPLSPTCSPRQHPHCPLAPSQVLASQLVHSSKIQSTASSQSSQTPPIQPPSVKPKKAREVFLGYPPSLKNKMWPTSCSGFLASNQRIWNHQTKPSFKFSS